MCFVFIWEQTATCATYSTNWLVFITEMKSVYSVVRTGSLNKAVCASSLKGQCLFTAPPPIKTTPLVIYSVFQHIHCDMFWLVIAVGIGRCYSNVEGKNWGSVLLGVFAKNYPKKYDNFTSVVLSACKNSAPRERISTKFDIPLFFFFENLFRYFKFH